MEAGRRERKKQQTRQAISDVGTRLFMARGFDEVTVAEVARAADVAVQTVFNHFPTKEDLFFVEPGWWTGPAAAIRAAPADAEPLAVLAEHYLAASRERLESGQLATWLRFHRTIQASPALRARRRQNAEQMETLIVEALTDRSPELDPIRARLLAAQYSAAHKVLEAELNELLPVDPAELPVVQAKLAEVTVDVFAILRAGWPDWSDDRFTWSAR